MSFLGSFIFQNRGEWHWTQFCTFLKHDASFFDTSARRSGKGNEISFFHRSEMKKKIQRRQLMCAVLTWLFPVFPDFQGLCSYHLARREILSEVDFFPGSPAYVSVTNLYQNIRNIMSTNSSKYAPLLFLCLFQNKEKIPRCFPYSWGSPSRRCVVIDPDLRLSEKFISGCLFMASTPLWWRTPCLIRYLGDGFDDRAGEG